MKIVYGTSNQSKLAFMRKRLEGLDVEIIGLDTIDKALTEPEETGKNPSDNAYIKAMSYYHQLKIPVMSADSGLFFEGVAEEDQPGVFIKRIHGKDLSGKEMVHYYSSLAQKYGGKLVARYKNALCLVVGEDTHYMLEEAALESEPFYIVSKPHNHYEEGFPLNCLSVEISTNQYYYDLETVKDKYERTDFDHNIRAFIEGHI